MLEYQAVNPPKSPNVTLKSCAVSPPVPPDVTCLDMKAKVISLI